MRNDARPGTPANTRPDYRGRTGFGRARQLTGPYTERDPIHDPFVMFAYLAGITERIGFATGVLVLPQRQTSRTGPSSLAAARSGDHEALLPGLRPAAGALSR